MKEYLSDHARLIKLEREIKQLACDLEQHIVNSGLMAPPSAQPIGKIIDFPCIDTKPLQTVPLRRDVQPNGTVDVVNGTEISTDNICTVNCFGA